MIAEMCSHISNDYSGVVGKSVYIQCQKKKDVGCFQSLCPGTHVAFLNTFIYHVRAEPIQNAISIY